MLRTAFVGLGRIASLLEDDPLREKPASHAGAFYSDSRCVISGGYDRDDRAARRFSERWDVPVFAGAREMLDAVRPDILVVATNPDSHERYVRIAVERRVPVVVCEKPLAHTYRSARRIAELERRSETRVVVNHERRFSRDYRLAAQAIRDGTMGRLVSVTARLFFGRTARRDRVFLHDGTHLVDAIHFLTGDRIRLSGRYGSMRSARTSAFLFGTLVDRRIPVMIEHGSERDYLLFEVHLSCTSGEILVGNGEFRWRRSVESPYYTGYRSLAESTRSRPEPSGYFSGMAEEAVSLAEDRERRSASAASDALNAMRVIGSSGRLFRRVRWNG